MKRVSALLFGLFFGATAIGLQLTIHDCGGRDAISIFGIPLNKKCTCDHQSRKHTDSCCHDHKFTIQTTHDFFLSSSDVVSFDSSPTSNIFILPNNSFFFSCIDHTYYAGAMANAPPESKIFPDNFLCVYRI